jgi:hypothetical protein
LLVTFCAEMGESGRRSVVALLTLLRSPAERDGWIDRPCGVDLVVDGLEMDGDCVAGRSGERMRTAC